MRCLTCMALLCCGVVLLNAGAVKLFTQTLHYGKPPDAKAGEVIYKTGCIACHGSTGKGAPASMTVFKRPDTFPDFTDCSGTTPEPNGNWKAAIVHGGPSRGLSQIMPAFGDLPGQLHEEKAKNAGRDIGRYFPSAIAAVFLSSWRFHGDRRQVAVV